MSTPARRVAVTALVASRNEARQLERCLASLAFCDEVIVIDLESTDGTADVARRFGARVLRHPVVPIAEYARVEVAAEAAHNWLLLTDPDEELPAPLARELADLVPQLEPDVAVVYGPIQFYFGGRPLRGTHWGGPNQRKLLVRRSGVELTATVFGGTRLRSGFREIGLPFAPETAIRHYWASGYRDWVEKHRRYLALAPATRADLGEVTGLRRILATPVSAFYASFVRKRGFLDGGRGLALSLLWAVFATASEGALFRERLRRARRSAG